MGGINSNKLQVLEMSEENEFTWTVKADLPAERESAASIIYEGKIWLIGGYANGAPTSSVLMYDIDADSWGTGPALPRAVTYAHAMTLNGEVYVVEDTNTWVYINAAWIDAVDSPRMPDLDGDRDHEPAQPPLAPGRPRGHVLQCVALG